MGVRWKMDCVEARLKFAAEPERCRPSQKMGLGMEELSLRMLSAVIELRSTKFNVPQWSREQVIWEMSVGMQAKENERFRVPTRPTQVSEVLGDWIFRRISDSDLYPLHQL